VLFFGDTNKVGIGISNPLGVLKVRLQTNPSPNPDHHISLDSLLFSRSPLPLHYLRGLWKKIQVSICWRGRSDHRSCIYRLGLFCNLWKMHVCFISTLIFDCSRSLLKPFCEKGPGLQTHFSFTLLPIHLEHRLQGVLCALTNSSQWLLVKLALLLSICSGNQANSEKGNQIEVIKCRAQAEHLNHKMDPNLALSHSLARFTTG
ncbi:hypothetical protein MJO28_013932, partial [Puccinia striiformis f. sp. tritici]